jgi:hypothetical protein
MQRSSARHFQWMIDQRLHDCQEPHRVRAFCMRIERCFVGPARVDVKQAGVAGGTKRLDRAAARLETGRRDDIAQCGGDGVPLAVAGMEAGEDEQVHSVPPWCWLSGRTRWRGWHRIVAS